MGSNSDTLDLLIGKIIEKEERQKNKEKYSFHGGHPNLINGSIKLPFLIHFVLVSGNRKH